VNAGLATRPNLRTDDEIVARFCEHQAYRVGYMEACLESARRDIEAAVRLIPARPTNEPVIRLLRDRLDEIERAQALAAKADAR
jgi:hypothetical protein